MDTKLFIIGVSGGIGSGKSSFASLLSEAGLPVLDADKISHQMTAAGGDSMQEIAQVFGSDFIKADGSLNRDAMANLAFRDKKALDILSAIIHKDVFAYMDKAIAELEKNGEKCVVLDVPIPVKEGFLDRCDLVVCLWTDYDLRLERLAIRGMDVEEAKRRIAVQMTEEEYRKISDYFILNNGSFEDLRRAAQDFLEKEFSSRGLSFQALI